MIPRGYGPDAAFCPRCAVPLSDAPPTVCGGCGYALFVNARPTVGLVVLDDPGPGPPGAGDRPTGPRFLALRRAAEPGAGRWETPGGFCEGWEHPAEAAVREAREELGVEVALGAQIGLYVGSYPFQGETLPVLDVFFLARLTSDEVVLDPAESSAMAWFPLVDPPEMAFSTMDVALRDAAVILMSPRE